MASKPSSVKYGNTHGITGRKYDSHVVGAQQQQVLGVQEPHNHP